MQWKIIHKNHVFLHFLLLILEIGHVFPNSTTPTITVSEGERWTPPDPNFRPPMTVTPHYVTKKKRVIPTIVTFQEECDYLAYNCLEIYKTGLICAKTMYQRYRQFRNYCELDYVNCRERYDVWTIAYMGPCLNKIEPATNYTHYEYLDDFFLDNYYVIQE